MLNSGQAALLIRPIAGDDLRPVHRQLQYWTDKAVVPPAGPVNTGKGSHRTYGPESTLLAAIAAALNRWKIPTPFIKLAIGALIRREVKADPKWHGESGRLQQIIGGKLDAMLVLQHTPNDSPKGIDYFFVPRHEVGEFLASEEFHAAGGSNALVLDLPALWRTVSAFGFEPGSTAAVKAAVEAQ